MDKSSDSDEGSVRHDRFRSERFRDESNKESERRAKSRDEVRRKYSDDRNSRNRQRDRSPLRNHHKWRETHSSSSTSRRERSDHERESRERDTRPKSSKGNSDDWAKFSKKMSERHKSENKETAPKKCLSSLLKSFDEKVDAKRLSENVVGPALPPRLVKAGETSVDNMDVDPSQGPSSPVHLKEDIKTDDASVSSKNSEDELNDPLPPPVSQENMVEKDSEPSISEGPALPPSLQQKSADNVENVPECSDSPDILSASTNLIEPIPPTEDRLGPAVPPEAKSEAYGPALPPKVEADSYGPALPPGLKKSSIKGPSLPKGISLEQVQEVKPDEEEEEDEEDTVGPLPEGKMTVTQFKLELRAAQIKQQLEEEKNGPTKEVKQREEWMLELPPGKAANLGLGPRSFRAREAPDMSDRSSWTDTPEDRRRKEEMAARGEVELNPADSEETMRLAMVQERDAAMDEMSKQSREDEREHSLLEMHQKKLNKKKKKQEKEEKEGKKKKERRPFDRNIDLQVNRFDEAQKKAIFKKAQLLDTRFSTGESKYL